MRPLRPLLLVAAVLALWAPAAYAEGEMLGPASDTLPWAAQYGAGSDVLVVPIKRVVAGIASAGSAPGLATASAGASVEAPDIVTHELGSQTRGTTTPSGSSLPFTGADVLAVVLAGCLLLTVGGALRRVARRAAL